MTRGIQKTTEFERVIRLPKRADTCEDLVGPLSTHLRKDHTCLPGCAGGVTRLNLMQVQALVEGHDRRGLFLQGPIGSGKTLVSMLLPAILQAQRPLLVIPGGSIVSKTVEDLKRYREHWRIPAIEIVTYEWLALEANRNFLGEFNPDLIVFDESHRIKDKARSVTRRTKRFHEDHPECVICVMSGTPAKRSINDFAHTMRWALRDWCPLPVVESDLRDWSLVLDAGVKDWARINPGALSIFGHNIQSIRRGVRDRLFSTPGCIASDRSEVNSKLIIALKNVPLSAEEDAAYQTLHSEWATPDGHTFTDAKDMWRYERQLARGYFGVWDPHPPKWWLEPRKAWHQAVRQVLSRSRTIDTAKQVASAVDRSAGHKLAPVLAAWREVEKKFKPNSVPVWTGTTALMYAANWLKGGGIAWTEHVAFGKKLAAMTGLPYFGEDGRSQDGRYSIVTFDGPACIASWDANGTGHNLQRYDRGLITSMWPTATIWDQTMGRQHRQGQKSAEVHFDVVISCRQDLYGFERASNEDGAFHKDLLAIPSRLVDRELRSERITQRGHAWEEAKRQS